MNENIQHYLNQFSNYLNQYDKTTLLEYSNMLLSEGKVSIEELYEEIITPSLNQIHIERKEEDRDIWKEHIQTNIVRTIIECAYPYVLKERKMRKTTTQRVMVLCPEEEYHEIGARMGADFFTINGYDVFFIGSNTPKENFISAYNGLNPDIIAISVTNYLNLVSLKKVVAEMKEKINDETMIFISGSALCHTKMTAKDIGADGFVNTFKEIEALRRDDHETGI